MLSRRYRVFLWTGPLIVISWLSLALLDPDPPSGLNETIGLGYFFGSLFGHTTLAAAWAAFGPGPVIFRVPLSLAWVAMLAVAVGTNLALHGGPNEAAFILGLCFLGQWLLLQLPFWGLVLGFRMRLRHTDDEQGLDLRQFQFGIRQLLLVTAVTGVVFGIGRVVVAGLPQDFVVEGEMVAIAFLTVAAVVVTVPLVLAGLMRQMAERGVLLALVLMAIATVFELPLLRTFNTRGGPGTWDFVAINAFTTALVLSLVVIVRLNGYSLSRSVAAGASVPSV